MVQCNISLIRITSYNVCYTKLLRVEQPAEFQVKELEEKYSGLEGDVEIGTASVRFFVALYTGLPYATETFLPQWAFDILKGEGKISEELASDFESKGLIVDVKKTEISLSNDKTSKSSDEEHNEVFVIKGKTTVITSYSIHYTKLYEVRSHYQNFLQKKMHWNE